MKLKKIFPQIVYGISIFALITAVDLLIILPSVIYGGTDLSTGTVTVTGMLTFHVTVYLYVFGLKKKKPPSVSSMNMKYFGYAATVHILFGIIYFVYLTLKYLAEIYGEFFVFPNHPLTPLIIAVYIPISAAILPIYYIPGVRRIYKRRMLGRLFYNIILRDNPTFIPDDELLRVKINPENLPNSKYGDRIFPDKKSFDRLYHPIRVFSGAFLPLIISAMAGDVIQFIFDIPSFMTFAFCIVPFCFIVNRILRIAGVGVIRLFFILPVFPGRYRISDTATIGGRTFIAIAPDEISVYRMLTFIKSMAAFADRIIDNGEILYYSLLKYAVRFGEIPPGAENLTGGIPDVEPSDYTNNEAVPKLVSIGKDGREPIEIIFLTPGVEITQPSDAEDNEAIETAEIYRRLTEIPLTIIFLDEDSLNVTTDGKLPEYLAPVFARRTGRILGRTEIVVLKFSRDARPPYITGKGIIPSDRMPNLTNILDKMETSGFGIKIKYMNLPRYITKRDMEYPNPLFSYFT